MRYIRYAFLAALGAVLISVSLANRQVVTLRVVPDALSDFIGANWVISLPLFIVVLAGIAAGLVIGFVWEWLREHKHRREASLKSRDVVKLEREVGRLKGERDKDKDEVLAILEEAS